MRAKATTIIGGALAPLPLVGIGIIYGSLLSQFLGAGSFLPLVIIVPIALIVGVAFLFIRGKMEAFGIVTLFSGIIESVAWPYIPWLFILRLLIELRLLR